MLVPGETALVYRSLSVHNKLLTAGCAHTCHSKAQLLTRFMVLLSPPALGNERHYRAILYFRVRACCRASNLSLGRI